MEVPQSNNSNYYNFKNSNFLLNLSNGLQELRNENEFFDVTLCCDNGNDQIQAHQVILAACSPLFRRILSRNNLGDSTKPLLYLKGVNQDDLFSFLDFMYQGETSVPQESLNAFLVMAEELEIKGLSKSMQYNDRRAAMMTAAIDDRRTAAINFSSSGSPPVIKSQGSNFNNREQSFNPAIPFNNNEQSFKYNAGLKENTISSVAKRLNPQDSSSRMAKAIIGTTLKKLAASSNDGMMKAHQPNFGNVEPKIEPRMDPLPMAQSDYTKLRKQSESNYPPMAQTDNYPPMAQPDYPKLRKQSESNYPLINDINGNSIEELNPEEYDDLEIDEELETEEEMNTDVNETPTNDPNGKPRMMNPTDEELSNNPIVKGYISKNDMGNFECQCCMQNSQSRKDLIRHIEAIHMDNCYECDSCNFPSKTRHAMENHMRKAHNKGKRKEYMNSLLIKQTNNPQTQQHEM